MYRNCVYNNREKKIHLFTWDKYGNRVTENWDYKPYLMLEDKSGKEKSIFGTSLKKKEFNDNFQRNKFVNEGGVRRIFENLPPYQQFLVDNYWHAVDDEDFSKHPLKVCIIDIECPSPPDRGFPNTETAEEVINLVVCYDSLSKRYTSFGLKKYVPKKDNVDYHHCKSEHDLLKRLIGHISSDYPDCLVGWNSADFDIPYLINRITFELGKEWADELSPIGRIYEKINKQGKFGQPTKEYVIEGISCLDYFVMYQKFNLEKQESYKLDHIGEVEVGKNKVHYEGTLWELARDNWETFVDYCLMDVELIVDLDAKLDYVFLTRFLAYNGLCGLQQAINTVPVINGAIAIKARNRDEYIPTFVRPQKDGKNPGGFVQESKIGFAENVVSFDANSLYPSVMISLNISPETKLGRVERVGNKVNIHHTSGRLFELTSEKFLTYIKEEKAALSSSGHLFSQKKKGIMPEFLDALYTKRKEMKAKGRSLQIELKKNGDFMSESEKLTMISEIQRCDTFQNAYKILLNSVYGYTGNSYAPLGDDDIATSVTLTGQAVNKKNRSLFVEYLTQKYGISESVAENCCIAGDTDSGYFSLKPLESVGYPLMEGNSISPKFYELCVDLEGYINTNITEWAKKTFRTIDCRLIYKREAISDSGIFLAKKHYVQRVLDDEGMIVNKFKYKGVAVVKTTMPRAIKPYVKRVIEHMILTKSLKETNELFNEAYEIFKALPIEDVSKNSGMNKYEEYCLKCDGLTTKKGMPAHLKAAYFHDYVLDQLNLTSKYEKFRSGDKVRIVSVKTPNRYNISSIGFKDTMPKEFEEIFEVDYELMFYKLFFAAIERFYDAVGWTLRKPSENLRVELDDLFGE